MKTLTLHTSPDHSQSLGELLTRLGAVAQANGDWLLNCGSFSETVLIVVLPVANDAALTTAIGVAVAQGQRVIGVWSQGLSGDLPQSLADYGAAAVGWSEAALRAVICGETALWEDAGGGARAGQFPKRNVC
ncbi:hypothetical protein [Brevundimonas sp.]|uniref:hypothetical protein n=1 Tax=Brevundimonas sp. TaxID=1871086 RepID=UPI00289DFCE0|nr:hypothetical protein [Brevundimonas sp.]